MDKLFSLFSSLCLGLGVILILSPIALYWFIHGDAERYIWLINGPYPFSHLGGGPFQLWVAVGLFAAGVVLMVFSCLIRKIYKRV